MQGGGLGLERNECNVLSVVEWMGMDGNVMMYRGLCIDCFLSIELHIDNMAISNNALIMR